VKRINVGLLWHAASAGNLGIGALTVGNIALARAAAARAGVLPHFTIFTAREGGDPYVADADIALRSITGRYMASPSGFLADLRTLDVMLDISGGDSFADIYSDKRFAYMVATKAATILAGKPLILSPQTIGPFSRQPHSMIAGWICNRAAMVFARDPLSMTVLQKLSPEAKAQQVIDVAFALPFDRPAPRGDGGIDVGLNVSALLMSGDNSFGLSVDYPALTRQLIAAFAARPGVRVHLVPHVIAPETPNEDDAATADALLAEFPQLVRHPDFTSPGDAKSFISGLDFLVGARMHATIAAYSSGVPVVPISYSRKFEGLFGGLDYPWLVPVKGPDTEAATAYIMDAFDQRAQLRTDIARGGAIVSAGLENYTAALAEQFRLAAR
jgi:polysaccharide pyruvyl transferase WcaK-like protein